MRFVLLIVVAGLSACAAADTVDDDSFDFDEVPVDPYREPPPAFSPSSEQDAGAFSVPERPRAPDAGSESPPDAGSVVEADASIPPPAACGAFGVGSLLLVELMIKHVDGAGDRAEWVELKNPADCVLTVPAGLRIVSPRGSALDVASVERAFELPPFGQFVAGGAAAPSHASLPTPRWTSSDVLKNSGDEVRIELGDSAAATVIDSLTYPQFSNLTAARSIAFPSDCAAQARASFQNWSGSFADYPPGPLVGTPFAPNDDVTCLP